MTDTTHKLTHQTTDRYDYADRHRKSEWRMQNFGLHRPNDDAALEALRARAWEHKRKQIRAQRGRDRGDLAAYAPAGAGMPWVSIGPRNVNGRVKCIAVHPTDAAVVYAGAASGGVWVSRDSGQSWRALWDTQESLAIGSLAICRDTPTTVYAATGEWTPGYGPSYPGAGVYVSTDAGVTWTRRAAVLARRIAKIVVSPTDANLVYVAGESGLERSTDGGVTWTVVRAGAASDVMMDPTNPQRVFVAIRNDAIYRTTDGGGTWTRLTAGPTSTGAGWLRLAMGLTGTNTTNFLLAKQSGTISRSTDGGTTWTTLAGSHGAAGHHTWCNLLAVAPDDQSIILAGGVGCERTASGGSSWTALGGMHADHHMAVFAASNSNIVYACDDAGVYRSANKGATWTKVSHGLTITQFYDIGSWDALSHVVGGGTQDVANAMTTGGLTWKPMLTGFDGGCLAIHPTNPRIMYGEHQNTSIFKTTDGGNSWTPATSGLSGSNPWTGIITMDQASPDRLFTGTTRVFRTTDGCATPWAAVSQDLGGAISAIAIARSDTARVYAGTGSNVWRSGPGRLYRTDDGGATTTWTEITGTLPSARSLLDIDVSRTDEDRLVVCYGGTTGAAPSSVFLSTNAGGAWTNISGDLPDVSVNAVVMHPTEANTFFVGTDVGVFRTTNGGTSWEAFDNGIPNVVVSDLHIDAEERTIYAATMGRGMYKTSIAGGTAPEVDLYLRDSPLDTGERFPSPSGLPHPNDAGRNVYFWESPDIKVESSPFYAPDALLDGVEFDLDVPHESAVRGQPNRFYLQVHNRGWRAATDVRVRAFFANASLALPNLPAALAHPELTLPNENTPGAAWRAVGPVRVIPTLEPNRPVVVSWDWTIPLDAATHSCLMAVVSGGDDPITTTETTIGTLITSEKRVCLKNLHVVNAGSAPSMMALEIHNPEARDVRADLVFDPIDMTNGTIGLLLERLELDTEKLVNATLYPLRPGEHLGDWPKHIDAARAEQLMAGIDRSALIEVDPRRRAEIIGIPLRAGQTLRAVVVCKAQKNVAYGRSSRFTISQRHEGKIVGGSTVELQALRARAMAPVSHIRVVLEKVQLKDDHDRWLKGRGEMRFSACVSFSGDAHRKHLRRIPEEGVLKLGDRAGSNVLALGVTLFDGLVAEKDTMTIEIQPVERDTFTPDDLGTPYLRTFNPMPESWPGTFTEELEDWALTYRVLSLPLP